MPDRQLVVVRKSADRKLFQREAPRASTSSGIRRALEAWSPRQRLPPVLTRQALKTEIATLVAALAPASANLLDQTIKRILAAARVHASTCAMSDGIESGYREAMKDLPGDLTNRLLAQITERMRRCDSLPTPTEMRDAVRQNLAHRLKLLTRAKTALLSMESQPVVTGTSSYDKRKQLRDMIRESTRRTW
jgi:hypothetical protein